MFEVFIVSVIYWTALLLVFLWLNRRLAHLKERIADLEAGGKVNEQGKRR
jgi:hypothetical protein